MPAKPRFRASSSGQLDYLTGCPEFQVPQEHPVRRVWSVVERLDTREIEATYSGLGSHGFHPKRLLAAWVYASLTKVHYASELARRCETDAAFRWLCGGGNPSDSTFKRFRRKHGEFFAAALAQTVAFAAEEGLLDLEEVAVDSMRLRAHASPSKVQRAAHSKQVLQALCAVSLDTLDEEARIRHERRKAKHERVVAECEARDVPNCVAGNALASLIKFPDGGSAPGHRITAVASSSKARLVIGVLVDASPNDRGKLPEAIESARDVLARAGLDREAPLAAAADAGYWDRRSLHYALEHSATLRVNIAEQVSTSKKHFLRTDFVADEGGVLHCPAGTPMKGPEPQGDGSVRWYGQGCSTCTLKSQCTRGKQRSLTIDLALEQLQNAVRTVAATPAMTRLGRRRKAIVEPVFAHIEDTMGYRRASSRFGPTIRAEVLLKLLAHNIARILAGGPLTCVWFATEN